MQSHLPEPKLTFAQRSACQSALRGMALGVAACALLTASAALAGYGIRLGSYSVWQTAGLIVAAGGLSGAAGGMVHCWRARKKLINSMLNCSFLGSILMGGENQPLKPTPKPQLQDISKTPPAIVDAVVNIQTSKAYFRNDLNPETIRRLLLSIDHTNCVGH